MSINIHILAISENGVGKKQDSVVQGDEYVFAATHSLQLRCLGIFWDQ